MAAFTDYAENKILDFLFRGQALTGINGATATAGTGPTNLYIGLLTVAPTDSTTGTEVTGNNYARVAVASSLTNWKSTQNDSTASTGTSGTTSNTNIITFNSPTPAGWGTVTSVGIYDSASAGNLLLYSTLTVSKTINAGDTVTFPVGSLTFQLDN
jgi:hypothetical protein